MSKYVIEMSLQSIIDAATTSQDIELANALSQLKAQKNWTAFVNGQQQAVYDSIKKQKDDTFQKAYGDLYQSQQIQGAMSKYSSRSKELAKLQDNIYANEKGQADAIIENKNTFGRKYEMNEWSVSNKKDTLFVFSALFVILSVLILFTVLYRLDLISSSVWSIICVVGIIIFVLIIINRAQYTNLLRNKRYWNKKNFPGKYGTLPSSNCPPSSSTYELNI